MKKMYENLFYTIEYVFTSSVGFRETSSCIISHKAIIYSEYEESNSLREYAGEVRFKQINIDLALNNGFDILEMFDTYEYTMRHGAAFYDFEETALCKQILDKYPELDFSCPSICIIETIGIIPKYRGRRLGAKAFKDLVWNFSSCCGLFVLQPYPLQFDVSRNKLKSELELERFESNEKKATKKLSEYYQSWGFVPIKGIKDLLFYCPFYKNEAFDNIDTED